MIPKHTSKIDNLIALCHILENYKDFEQKLGTMLDNEKNHDFLFQVWNISKGKKILRGKTAKKFYNENKEIIDKINSYTNIYRFVTHNFTLQGKPTKNLEFFYNYLTKNKNNLTHIIKLLEELQKLEFDEITFDQELKPNEETHMISNYFNDNIKMTHVANPIVIPTYTEQIQYTTNDTNYKMELTIITNKIALTGRKIILNNLLFDINSLPTAMDKEHIFDPLLAAKKEQINATALIKNSINLNVSIEDLEEQLINIHNVINQMDNINSKKEFINILLNIKSDIEKLKLIGMSYNNDIVNEEKTLTKEILKKEKTLYLNRRELAQKDWY